MTAPVTTNSAMARALRIVRHVTIISSEEALSQQLNAFAAPQKSSVVAFINAHGFNIIWDKDDVAEDFAKVDYLLRDGVGLEILFSQIGTDAGLNLNGTDLIPRILERAKGKRIALYGTKDPWLSKSKDVLEQQGQNIVSVMDGWQDSAAYVRDATSAKPDVIVLAMGMPKQERVAIELRAALTDHPATIICGGAILDFLADRFPRAPEWMRKAKLEWLFRLAQEPRRLFKRYVIGNVLFLRRAKKIRKSLEA